MTDDRLEERLLEAARRYHEPPQTPREEIWARLEQHRSARQAAPPRPVPFAWRARTRWLRPLLAAAAVLMLGIAIGRLTLAPSREAVAPAVAGDPRVGPGGRADSAGPASLATRLAAAQHLTRVEALLVEYETGAASQEMQAAARDLLFRTRLWLDAGRAGDPALRRLLEDLELVLMQITQLAPNGQPGEREWIDQGLAEREIRPRLRNAIPTGPAA